MGVVVVGVVSLLKPTLALFREAPVELVEPAVNYLLQMTFPLKVLLIWQRGVADAEALP